MNITKFMSENNFSLQSVLPYIIGIYGATMVTFLFRNVPSQIIAWLAKHTTTTLTFTSNLPNFFMWMMERFEKEGVLSKARSLRFYYRAWEPKVQKGIGEGNQMFIFRKKLIWLSHTVQLMQMGQLNSIQLTVLGRNHSFLDSLKEEFEHYTEKETSDSDETFIYTFETEWKCERTIKKRSFDTVFLDSNTKTILTDHLDTFYSREEWYEKRGIPYQTGILLYGEPGTGKTSIVRALAGKYNKRLCIIQAAQLTELANALRTLPLDSFIVIEDIDVNSIIHTREKNTGVRPREENIVEADSSAKVCLSEILNALDGIISVRGRVLFLTTNHIEVLDKAFIRPGRVDLSVNISYTTLEAFKEFVRVFYVDKLKPGETLALESLREIKKVTIAQLQNDFMNGMEAEALIAKYALMQSDFITAHNLPAKAAG